jgi:hypothetical protein
LKPLAGALIGPPDDQRDPGRDGAARQDDEAILPDRVI